jgi:Arc/MetJ-type ribon-helix-helix transcriptional regulator
MARRASDLSKKSLVVHAGQLREWMALGKYRTESEAVRDAVARSLAIRKMQDAIAALRASRTFARHFR